MNNSNGSNEHKFRIIPQDTWKRRRTYVFIFAAVAVLVLAGVLIACILKNTKPILSADPDPSISNADVPAVSSENTATEEDAQYGRLELFVPPYITSGSKLYFHVANTSAELALSELEEAAYGFDGSTVEFDLLSESGELSDRIYLRNPTGSKTDTTGNYPLYWVFDFVCDTYLEYQGRTIYGRYGLIGDDSFYPGKLLGQDIVEIYECLTDGDEPVEDLYIMKVNADISRILDIDPVSAEASDTWWEMKPVYEASWPDDWAILLLASPDWKSFRDPAPLE